MTVDLKLAEAVLRLIVFRRERSDQYEVVNKQLIELDSGGLQGRVSECDGELWGAVMKVLDMVLGDEDANGDGLASYFAECSQPTLGGHGLVRWEDGREFKLNTVEEVLAYIAARNAMMTR